MTTVFNWIDVQQIRHIPIFFTLKLYKGTSLCHLCNETPDIPDDLSLTSPFVCLTYWHRFDFLVTDTIVGNMNVIDTAWQPCRVVEIDNTLVSEPPPPPEFTCFAGFPLLLNSWGAPSGECQQSQEFFSPWLCIGFSLSDDPTIKRSFAIF